MTERSPYAPCCDPADLIAVPPVLAASVVVLRSGEITLVEGQRSYRIDFEPGALPEGYDSDYIFGLSFSMVAGVEQFFQWSEISRDDNGVNILLSIAPIDPDPLNMPIIQWWAQYRKNA